MEQISSAWLAIGLVALVGGPSGAAWIGTKVALNGIKNTIDRIDKRQELHETRITDNEVSIARMEGPV